MNHRLPVIQKARQIVRDYCWTTLFRRVDRASQFQETDLVNMDLSDAATVLALFYEGNDRFLLSLKSWATRKGRLTPKQATALLKSEVRGMDAADDLLAEVEENLRFGDHPLEGAMVGPSVEHCHGCPTGDGEPHSYDCPMVTRRYTQAYLAKVEACPDCTIQAAQMWNEVDAAVERELEELPF